ncbi:MAG: hypothetical protein HRU33_03590 [Rhodobacteraceae bacterium]|nr:hypothetical protein [Paracoccaceae bacterium]
MTTENYDNANTAHALQNTERVVSGHNNGSLEAMLRYAKDAHKRIPTASNSYITVRINRDFWDVIMATPVVGKTLPKRLYGLYGKAMAYDMARKTETRIERPFKAKGGAM